MGRLPDEEESGSLEAQPGNKQTGETLGNSEQWVVGVAVVVPGKFVAVVVVVASEENRINIRTET